MNHFANNGKEYLKKDSKFDYQGICFFAFIALGIIVSTLKILNLV